METPVCFRVGFHLYLAALVLNPWVVGCYREGHDAQGPSFESDASVPAWFEDVAVAAGIDFVHENGARGDYQLPEIMGSGCAWIDYDQDGDLDAYLVSAGFDRARARNRLYRNDGDGTFTDVSGASGADDDGFGMGCAAGDYDGNGYPDLYVTNFGPNTLYRNNGDGTFTDVTAAAGTGDPRWSASAAFVDVDEDGHLDLFVTNYMKHPARSPTPCADAAGRTEYCGPNSHFPPERDTLYRNQGDGTFRDVTAAAGMAERYGNGLGVACGDFNGDGHVDLYVANDESPNQLWIGDGKGHFVDRAVEWGAAFNRHGQPQAGMGVQAEDVDGDGHLDLLVTNLVNETNTFYRGNGRGLFDDVTPHTGLAEPSLAKTGFGMGLFDADDDGDLDLMVTNGRVRRGSREEDVTLRPPWDLYAENDQFFENVKGDGPLGFRFVERSRDAGRTFREPHLGRGLALGDYDNDGDVDLLVTACGGRARLLRNQAPRRGHWLMVRAVRPGGKGDVYGAQVTVEAAGKIWRRRVEPAYSYLASNDPRLHFGLGDAERADVTVRWPDGTSVERKAAVADRLLIVEKGKPEARE